MEIQDLLDIGFTKETIAEMERYAKMDKDGIEEGSIMVSLYNYIICEYPDNIEAIPSVINSLLKSEESIKRKFIYAFKALGNAPEDVKKSVVRDMIEANFTRIPLDMLSDLYKRRFTR